MREPIKRMKEYTAVQILKAIIGHPQCYHKREGGLFKMLRKARQENEVIQNETLKRALDFMQQQFEAIRDWCEEDIASLEAEELRLKHYHKEMQRLKDKLLRNAPIGRDVE